MRPSAGSVGAATRRQPSRGALGGLWHERRDSPGHSARLRDHWWIPGPSPEDVPIRPDTGAGTSLARVRTPRICQFANRSMRTRTVVGPRHRHPARASRGAEAGAQFTERLAKTASRSGASRMASSHASRSPPTAARTRAFAPSQAQRRNAARAVGEASRPCPRPSPFALIVPPALPPDTPSCADRLPATPPQPRRPPRRAALGRRVAYVSNRPSVGRSTVVWEMSPAHHPRQLPIRRPSAASVLSGRRRWLACSRPSFRDPGDRRTPCAVIGAFRVQLRRSPSEASQDRPVPSLVGH